MTTPSARWIILGNPENRRVTMFQAALAAQGQDPATVVSWEEFLETPSALAVLSAAPSILRIESFGENTAVDRQLLRRGALSDPERARLAPEQVERLTIRRGEIVAPRQAHLGFLSALGDIERIIEARPQWRALSPPHAIADCFDKRITSRLYESLGVPVPPRLEGVATPAELRAALDARGWGAVFVKLASGSSASCLGILERRGGRETFTTTIEVTRDGWYNNLRLQRIMHPGRIDEVVGFLLEEGAHIEQALPKARLGEDNFDCRVVVIAGEPAFTVVRESSHPITNLHLGGRRGDVEALLRMAPPDVYAAAMESCRRVGRAHGCLAIGVDLMFEEGFAGHRVLEGNAFGDLLPNLTRDGLSVYEWEIQAAIGRRNVSPVPA